MYCFTCKEDFESMMTCIYRVWEAKKGSQNVRLEIEPVEQMDLLTEYVHVEVDPELAHKVVRSIRTKVKLMKRRVWQELRKKRKYCKRMCFNL